MEIDKIIKVVFPQRLRYYMTLYKMSQAETARAIGVSTATLCLWLQGTREPKLSHIDALCKVFGCERNDLVNESPLSSTPIPRNDDEVKLLEGFRKLTDLEKGKVLGMVMSTAGSNEEKQETVNVINNMDPDQLEAFTKFVALPEEQRNALKMLIKGLQ